MPRIVAMRPKRDKHSDIDEEKPLDVKASVPDISAVADKPIQTSSSFSSSESESTTPTNTSRASTSANSDKEGSIRMRKSVFHKIVQGIDCFKSADKHLRGFHRCCQWVCVLLCSLLLFHYFSETIEVLTFNASLSALTPFAPILSSCWCWLSAMSEIHPSSSLSSCSPNRCSVWSVVFDSNASPSARTPSKPIMLPVLVGFRVCF